ncbi:50S ribosomal protein L24 [Nitrosomonas sp. ANs5]|uniref:50S ribosomal protein L24 n=1 Tax=Nitrosomonas sp. ANs5 TaxID=3423941 RepID=UPI003D32534A
MKKIRKGDDVIVIAGKDKGKRSTILKYESDEHVIVQDVNKVKKHVKPNPNKNVTGGIIEMEKPIHISNIAIYNFSAKKADRVGFKLDESGLKVRYFKSDGSLIDS